MRKADERRRELARQVRRMHLEELLEAFRAQGVERAFLVYENGQFTLSHPRLLASLAAFFELSHDFARHEAVFIGREGDLPTLFFAFVHDTRRGLSQGGLRYCAYDNVAAVLADGLRLSQGMTRKNALAGLWWGGGKGILPITRAMQRPEYLEQGAPLRLEVFRAYARFVASLGGVYYTAEDVGTKTSDMDAMLSQNRFQTCVSSRVGGSGNPSPATARGVFWAMQAAWRFLTGSDRLQGVRVAVQGAGNVGGVLIELLDEAGAEVWTSDVSAPVLAALREAKPHVHVVPPAEILGLDVDVLAPCAIGNQINVDTIPKLKAKLVCGAANNILGEPADAERLRERGIAFVPDYVCNRMGITNCADEWQGYLAEDVQVAARRLYPDTLRILKHARNLVTTTTAAADELADVAASELHPLLGHRGRRIVDHLLESGWQHGGETAPKKRVDSAFVPTLHEEALRLGWKRTARFDGATTAVAATPIPTAARPNLASVLSAVLADVRARSLEADTGRPTRRVLGADHGGLTLQLTVERSLPYEREATGRAEFVALCHDLHNKNDAAIRSQLDELGVDFDPGHWLDPMDPEGATVVRRLYFSLLDAGMVKSEHRLGYHCPRCSTILVDSEVKPTVLKMDRRYRVACGDGPEALAAETFFPELLVGAVALAVREGGTFGHLAGSMVPHPLTNEPMPVVAAPGLDGETSFLVPAAHRADERLARQAGIDVAPPVYDDQGAVLVGGMALAAETARELIVAQLAPRLTELPGGWTLRAHRCRRCETLVIPSHSEQLFLHFERAVPLLHQAIESGAVRFDEPFWRSKVAEHLAHLEPLCISRQQWWGNELPGRGGEVFSTWFSLIAWSLAGMGWPLAAAAEPIDEVFVDPDRLLRWVVPSELVALALTGRPAFRRVAVHGAVHLADRELEPVPGVPANAPDEERFRFATQARPMRKQLGNVVEPTTLVRRFGADALRVGLLLCLGSGRPEVATISEGSLRLARRALHRLGAQLAGLWRATEGQAGEAARTPPVTTPVTTVPEEPGRDLLAGLGRAADAALAAYADGQPWRAAHALVETVDLLRTYGERWATWRSHVALGAGAQKAARATLAAAVGELARGFTPIAPFTCARFAVWLEERGLQVDSALDSAAPVGEHLSSASRNPRCRPKTTT